MPKRSAIFVPALLLIFTLSFGAYCRFNGLYTNFLRVESGWFVDLAHADMADLRRFAWIWITHSYNGHFAPVAFVSELLQSRLIGASEKIWFWRQMFVVATLGTAIALAARRLARTAPVSTIGATIFAVSSAVFFLCQPFILELASWPFMALLLMSLAMSALAVVFLVDFAVGRDPNRLLFFLLAAYGAMHFSGVGAAMSGAAILVAVLLVVEMKARGALSDDGLRRSVQFILSAVILNVLHAALMLHDTDGDVRLQMVREMFSLKQEVLAEPPVQPPTVLQALMRLGLLFMDSAFAGLRAMWGSGGGFVWPRFDIDTSPTEAVYALAFFVMVSLGLGGILAKARSEAKPHLLASCAVSIYAWAAFVIYIAMVAIRLRTAPPDAALNFLIGPRYVIYPAFFLFLGTLPILVLLLRAIGRPAVAIAVVAALGAALSTSVFARTMMPKIWPYVVADTRTAWTAAVAKARAELAAGTPLTDTIVDFGESKHRLSNLKRALERELGCKGCATFQGS